MVTLSVDRKSCKGDGRCVEICPMQILVMNKDEKVPEFIPGGAETCINCGHCVSFCPPASLSLSSMDAKKCQRLDHSKLPSAEGAELLMKGRRSVRLYKDVPVPKEAIEKIIDIARYAPSGINRQPVSWAVLNGKDKVHELASLTEKWTEDLIAAKSAMAEAFNFSRIVKLWNNGEDTICRGAPCVIIAYGVKDDPLVPQSCTIAATYLELAAFASGLGACWAGYVNMAINTSDEVRKFAGLPSRAIAGAVMMVGEPKYRFSRIPSRNPARILWK